MCFFTPPFFYLLFFCTLIGSGNERKKKPKLTRAEDLPPFPSPSPPSFLPQEKKTPKQKKVHLDSSFSCNFFWGAKLFWVFFFFGFSSYFIFLPKLLLVGEKMPQLNGGGGDDLGANDELICRQRSRGEELRKLLGVERI